jgi:hypothetical protein
MRQTGCRSAIEVPLSPLQFGGERPGEGGQRRAQFDLVRRTVDPAATTPLSAGNEGEGPYRAPIPPPPAVRVTFSVRFPSSAPSARNPPHAAKRASRAEAGFVPLPKRPSRDPTENQGFLAAPPMP